MQLGKNQVETDVFTKGKLRQHLFVNEKVTTFILFNFIFSFVTKRVFIKLFKII